MSNDSKSRRKRHEGGGEGDVLGVTVAWDFHKLTLMRSDVADMFERHGFTDCVDYKYEEDARARLKFAPDSGEVSRGSRIVISEMERKNEDTPAALAIYLKKSKSGERGDAFKGGARVRIDPQTDLAVVLPMEGETDMEPTCEATARQVAERCNIVRTHVTNKELSVALCNAGPKTFWAPYRYAGGTWFIREGAACDRFCGLLEELEKRAGTAVVQTFYGAQERRCFEPSITELRKDSKGRNEANVKRYAAAAVESQMADIIRQLERWEKKANGRVTTMEKRLADCDEVIERAEFYAPLLREVADKMVAKVKAVKSRLGKCIDEEKDPNAVFAKLDAKLSSDKAAEVRQPDVKKAAPNPEPVTDEALFSI